MWSIGRSVFFSVVRLFWYHSANVPRKISRRVSIARSEHRDKRKPRQGLLGAHEVVSADALTEPEGQAGTDRIRSSGEE